MTIGYGRVSKEDQDLTRQVDALQKAGCDKMYLDKISGSKHSRPELDRLLMEVEPGDTVVIHKLDRLGRSLRQLLSIVDHWRENGIHFRSLTENFDTSTAQGRFFFTIIAAVAELEREYNRERTSHALYVLKQNGKKLGRPMKNQAQTKSRIALMVTQGLSDAQIQEQLKIGRSTYYKLKKI
jgi:DNA invertase Pin-like site-specific DNA recombinase